MFGGRALDSLAAACAFGALFACGAEQPPAPAEPPAVEASATILDPQALRTALEAERARTAELEAQVAWLQDRIEELAAAALPFAPTSEPADPNGTAAGAAEPAEAPVGAAAQTPWFRGERLGEMGAPPDEVERLEAIASQALMRSIELSHQATREGWFRTQRYWAAVARQEQQLRGEIGDADFDLMLWATGRPNRVVIADLLPDAPGRRAGLRPGDVVVRYGETAIFRGDDLRGAAAAGTPRDWVEVEVLRDGERVRVDLPRGPIGARLNPIRVRPETPW
jgi:hypothetical protein